MSTTIERILYAIHVRPQDKAHTPSSAEMLEIAGARGELFFDPSHTVVGIVGCGGLCPGINDVIRSSVRSLWYLYGVRRIIGIRNGYKGLLSGNRFEHITLDPEVVDDIQQVGGTILGTSRGAASGRARSSTPSSG